MITNKKTCSIFIAFLIFFSVQAQAEEFSFDKFTDSGTISPEIEGDDYSVFNTKSDYAYYGDIWRPLVSMVIPGFDQYLNRQYRWGLGYTVATIGASVYALDASERLDDFKESDEYLNASEAQRDDWDFKRYGIHREQYFAEKLVYSTLFMSAYHSFRTAVRGRQQFGQYEFLDVKYEESPQKILLTEPFNFSYLKRPTTWGWLAFETAWVIVQYVTGKQSDDYESDSYTFEDAAYASGIAYLAGTTEEALFRGYLMPVAREYTKSNVLANLIQAGLFTLAHNISPNVKTPIMGYYHGWLTQRNNWQIGESVFIHFWADVISLSATYMLKKDDSSAVMMLPMISLTF